MLIWVVTNKVVDTQGFGVEVYDPSMMKIRLTHKRAYVPGSKLRDGHPTFNRESL